jgi:DNA invertase Pin-like site-specific DNA recombinase
LDYAQQQGLRVDTVVEIHAAARHARARRSVEAVLAQVKPGDLLLVSELSRLGQAHAVRLGAELAGSLLLPLPSAGAVSAAGGL